MTDTWVNGVNVKIPPPPSEEEWVAPAYCQFIEAMRELGIEHLTEDFIRMGCNVEAFEWLAFQWKQFEFDPPQAWNVINDWRAALELRRKKGEP